MNQDVLSDVERFLDQAGRNYTVFLRAFAVPTLSGQSLAQAVRAALGRNVAISQTAEVGKQEAMSEVWASLTYAGDHAAGPDPAAMQSEEFARLLGLVMAEVSSTAQFATKIEQFQISEGHPAYPVFWEFAFLFTGPSLTVVLVGSSSD